MSHLEDMLAYQLEITGFPKPVREYRFHESKRWRADFAYPKQKLLIEAEGGTWSGGRHVRGKGFEIDCRKYNAAVMGGWKVLRFTREMIVSGEALNVIEVVLKPNGRKKKT